MQVVAQNWLVLRFTGTAAAVGVTVALQALPSVFLGLAGGVLADRVPKRRVLVVTQTMLAALALVLGVTALTGTITVGIVYALALALGLVIAIDGPSNAAFGAELVPNEDLASAVALGSVMNGLGRILGMSAAGVLVATVGAGPIFVANGLSYLVVAAVVARIPVGELRLIERPRGKDAGLRSGLQRARRTPAIALTATIALVVAAFGRNYQVTMAAMSQSVFRSGARGYAECSLVFAVGAVCGGLLAARLRLARVRGVVLVALAGSALEFVAGVAPSLAAFASVVLPIAAAAVMFDTAALCVVQLAAGDALRGRALAILGTTSMIGATLGAPTLGWTADHAGARASLELGSVVVGASTLALAAVVVTWSARHVFTFDGPFDEERAIAANCVPTACTG